jgi:DNA-binding transcriptional LysR family regulator
VPQLDETAGMADFLLNLGRLAGEPLTIRQRVHDFVTALSFVAAGDGVALIPGSFENLKMKGVTCRSIAGYEECASLALAWRSYDPSSTVTAFVRLTGRDMPGGGNVEPNTPIDN